MLAIPAMNRVQKFVLLPYRPQNTLHLKQLDSEHKLSFDSIRRAIAVVNYLFSLVTVPISLRWGMFHN
jgi:hypothetical protein